MAKLTKAQQKLVDFAHKISPKPVCLSGAQIRTAKNLEKKGLGKVRERYAKLGECCDGSTFSYWKITMWKEFVLSV